MLQVADDLKAAIDLRPSVVLPRSTIAAGQTRAVVRPDPYPYRRIGGIRHIGAKAARRPIGDPGLCSR